MKKTLFRYGFLTMAAATQAATVVLDLERAALLDATPYFTNGPLPTRLGF